MGVGALRMHRRPNNNPDSAKVIFDVQVCTDLWKRADGVTQTVWKSTEYIVEYMPRLKCWRVIRLVDTGRRTKAGKAYVLPRIYHEFYDMPADLIEEVALPTLALLGIDVER